MDTKGLAKEALNIAAAIQADVDKIQNEPPKEIWIPTYGTDRLFDEWLDEAEEDAVRYVHADLYEQMQRRANSFEIEAAKLQRQLEELKLTIDH